MLTYVPSHDLALYAHPHPAQMVAAVPGATALDGLGVAVRPTLQAMQACAALGLPFVSPMAGYDWPARKLAPFDHQRVTAAFLAVHRRAFCFNDMGTGKTLASLWAADWLMRRGEIRKALVVTPLSTLKSVWFDEIFKHFLGRRTAVILNGSREKRQQLLRQGADFYLINHDGLAVGGDARKLGVLADTLRCDKDVGLVIVDECSAYRQYQTLRSRVLKQVSADKPYLWLMTGTPTPNGPMDAHGLGHLLGTVREGQNSFRERVMVRLSRFKWRPRHDANATVHRVLAPALRYHRSDCIDLPPCLTERRDVELSPDQRKHLDALKREALTLMTDGTAITAVNEAVLRLKALQISLGCVYGDQAVHETDAAPRLRVLRDVIDEVDPAAKILVFAPFTAVVHHVEKTLRADGLDAAAITGATSPGQRAELVRCFQDPADGLRLLVADPGTMAHGLTLTAANTVIWYGPTDRAEYYQQANDRVNRPGQVRPTLIVQLAATALEREIFARLQDKQSLQGALLTLVKEGER